MTTLHKEKFQQFIKACEQPIDKIVIAHLGVIGDNIGEVETNIRYAISNNKEIHVADGFYVIKKYAL